MHRKYQVKSSKWRFLLLLAEAGSQGRRRSTLQAAEREGILETAGSSESEPRETSKTTKSFRLPAQLYPDGKNKKCFLQFWQPSKKKEVLAEV